MSDGGIVRSISALTIHQCFPCLSARPWLCPEKAPNASFEDVQQHTKYTLPFSGVLSVGKEFNRSRVHALLPSKHRVSKRRPLTDQLRRLREASGSAVVQCLARCPIFSAGSTPQSTSSEHELKDFPKVTRSRNPDSTLAEDR